MCGHSTGNICLQRYTVHRIFYCTNCWFFYSLVGRLWTSCRQTLSTRFLSLYSKGRFYGLKKISDILYHIVSCQRGGVSNKPPWAPGSDKTRDQGSFGPFTGGLDLRGSLQPAELIKVTKENEKLSGQNMSTGCPQPMDYMFQWGILMHTLCTLSSLVVSWDLPQNFWPSGLLKHFIRV